MVEVRGVPELLDEYTERTLPAVERVLDALGRYRAAVAAYNAAARNDLGSRLEDLSDDLIDTLRRLGVLDRVPTAFAAALRELDASYDPGAAGPALSLSAPSGDRLRERILDEFAGQDTEYAGTLLDPGQASFRDDLQVATRAEDLRGSLAQFGRVGGNALLARDEGERLAALRARYPHTRAWLDANDLPAQLRLRTGGAYNRVVVQAARSADDAAGALRTNRPLLPSLGVPGSAQLARLRGATYTGLGAAGMGLSFLDGISDFRDEDWGGVTSNATSIVGSALLMASGGPITMTVGAVLVVGSLIYENREELGRLAGWAGERLGSWTGGS